jgi:hypothetical protein
VFELRRINMIPDVLIPMVGSQFDVNSAADKYTFTIPFKCDVKRIFLVIEGTDTGGATVKFDKRPTAGSDTDRGDGDVGTITIPGSNCQGKMYYEDPSTVVTLDEGDQVVVQVTAEGVSALNVVPGMLLMHVPEVPANNSAMVAG